jgi:hypothetical protein
VVGEGGEIMEELGRELGSDWKRKEYRDATIQDMNESSELPAIRSRQTDSKFSQNVF